MWKERAKPMNLIPFDQELCTIPVSDRCVFEPQTLRFLEECGSLRAQ